MQEPSCGIFHATYITLQLFPRKVLIILTNCLIVAKYLDKINCFLLY